MSNKDIACSLYVLNYFFHRFSIAVPISQRGFSKGGQWNMAPQQQNSTFIDDNLDSCPSLLNLPESPILPPRRCQNQDTNNNNNNNKQAAFEERLVDESPSVGEPPLAPPIPLAIPMAPAPPHRQACKNKHGRENGNAGQASRRHRSISLYGVNSTVVSASSSCSWSSGSFGHSPPHSSPRPWFSVAPAFPLKSNKSSNWVGSHWR